MSTTTERKAAAASPQAGGRSAPEPGRRAGRVTRGLLAAILLVALVVGIPIGLWVFGVPVLGGQLSWAKLVSVLSTPDVTGEVLLSLVTVVGWLAWATFTVAALVELVSAIRGVRAPRLRGMGVQQRVAAALIGAVVTMVLASPGAGQAVASSQVVDPVDGQATDLVAADVLESSPETAPAAKTTRTRADAKIEQAKAASSDANKSYTVRPGDSLWRIARETLGDGTRFKEVAHLNYGVTQADGGALDGSHWVQPGWVLTLPGDATGSDVVQTNDATRTAAPSDTTDEPAGSHQVTVERGDTLWDIAEDELGDGTKYPEIYEATRPTTQPDGRRITDPDLIYPGWQVTVPGAAANDTGADDTGEKSEDRRSEPRDPETEKTEPQGGSDSDTGSAHEDTAAQDDAEDDGGEPGGSADETPRGEDATDDTRPDDSPSAAREDTETGTDTEADAEPVAREAHRGEKNTAAVERSGAEESDTGESGAEESGAGTTESTPRATEQPATPPLDRVEESDTDEPEIQDSLPPTGQGGDASSVGGAAGPDTPDSDDAPATDDAPAIDDTSATGEESASEGTPADTTKDAEATTPTFQEVTPEDLAGEPALEPGAAAPEIVESPAGTEHARQAELTGADPDTDRPDTDRAVEEQAGAAASATTTARSAGNSPAPATSAALTEATLSEEFLESFDVRTATGVGGLLAAGILALLAARRGRARRRRKPGERIALPEPGTPPAEFETDLRAVADDLGREQVDVALRTLAGWHRERGLALPGVRVARLKAGELVELYLDRAAELPPPWVSTTDRYVWQLPAGENPAVASTTATPELMESPYPSLVTLGHDDENAHLMVDLENIGCLDIRGSDEATQGTLAALAVELATSLWADDLQVTVVGTLRDLPGVVDTGRIRHVPSVAGIVRELEARAADVDRTLAQVGAASLPEARGRGLAMDAWTPEILLVGEQLGTAERTRLESLVERVPGVGIAAVTSRADIGEWMLDLTGDLTGGETSRGVLVPAYIAVRPQMLDAATYLQALELLGDPEPVAGPEWARNLPADEPALVEPEALPDFDSLRDHQHHSTAVNEVEAVAEDVVEAPVSEKVAVEVGAGAGGVADVRPPSGAASGAVDLVAGPTSAPAAPVGPAPSGPVDPDDGTEWTGDGSNPWVAPRNDLPEESDRNGGSEIDPATAAVVVDEALRAPEEPRPAPTPVIRVIGPVELAGCAGVELPASHQRQAMELVAFLAFNPGARGADISRALWPSRDPNLATRRSAVSRARRWLGTDAYGFEYLPRYWSTDDGSQVDQEKAGYRLRGVTTDWEQFCELVGPDITETPVSDLRRALDLVRGVPFQDTPPRKYVWAEVLMQEMAAGVVDVAHEVSRRALAEGDLATAREASRVGRKADPADERSWRNSIRTEYASGRMDAAGRLIDRLRDHLEQLDMEPEPETEDLINEVDAAARPKP